MGTDARFPHLLHTEGPGRPSLSAASTARRVVAGATDPRFDTVERALARLSDRVEVLKPSLGRNERP
jgi:hypothetical protein